MVERIDSTAYAFARLFLLLALFCASFVRYFETRQALNKFTN